MAEVIVTQQAPTTTNVGGVMDAVFAPIRFLLAHWQFFVITTLIVIILTVFIIWWMNKEEEKKEMEDMLYRSYKDDIRTAKKNQDPLMYTKKYSWWNWCVLFLPIIHKKVGRKVYDHRQNFVGYYDGQFVDMLGNTVMMLWKDKMFLFFKDHFLLRLPQKAYTIRKEVDKKVKVPEGADPKYMTVVSWKPLPEGLLTRHEDKTQSVKMINMIKRGFYYYPVYTDEKMQMVDLTETINTLNHINSSNILLESVIKEAGKNVVGMAKTNTELVFEQKKPEKVRDVEKDEE